MGFPWLWRFPISREVGYGRFRRAADAHTRRIRQLLQEKDLALLKHQPYLVRWVKDFLLFAKEHGGYTFEQTLDLFLAQSAGATTCRWPA